MEWSFKKGDVVPVWLEKSDEVNMEFGVDVSVIKNEDGYHVFPLEELKGGHVIKAVAKIPGSDSIIVGGPTFIYSKPQNKVVKLGKAGELATYKY